MILPPTVIDVHVRERDARNIRIWFPFFILWPLLLVIVLFVAVVTMLVDIAMFLAGSSYHHFTQILIGAMHLIADTRGTVAYINSPTTFVDIKIH